MVQVGPLGGDAMVDGGDPKKVDFAIGKLLTNLHVNDDRISKYSSVIIVFGVTYQVATSCCGAKTTKNEAFVVALLTLMVFLNVLPRHSRAFVVS